MRNVTWPTLVALALTWTPSWACDGAEKSPQFLTAGPLPANAGGVLWWNGRWATVVDCGTASDCQVKLPAAEGWRIERLDGEKATAVAHRVEPVLTTKDHEGALRTDAFLLAPVGGFEAGRRYRFHAPDETRPVELEISTERLEPGGATLTVGDQGTGPIRGAPPGSKRGVIRTLGLKLPEQAERFEGALAYETIIGGRRWREALERCEYAEPDRALAGRGEDRLSMTCDHVAADALIQPGHKHRVVMSAALPGTKVALSASAEVLLQCAKAEAQPGSAASGCGSCATDGRQSDWGWWALTLVAAIGLRRVPAHGAICRTPRHRGGTRGWCRRPR